MLVLYASVLCLPEDGHLSPKHAGEFVCMDKMWYYFNFVYLLVCMDDVVHIYVLINKFLCFIYNIVWNFMVISLFISLVLIFIGVHFVVAYMLLIVRNWASWLDRPFIRGDVENDFNLLLTTNILSLAVPEPFWVLVAKLTVCDRFFFFSSSSSIFLFFFFFFTTYLLAF